MLLNVWITSTFQNKNEMEFRNPYFGLDELYAQHRFQSSVYPKIVNEPKLAAQISSAEPDKVFPVDLHQWLSDFGQLSPPDRRVQFSKMLTPSFNTSWITGWKNLSSLFDCPPAAILTPPIHVTTTVRLSICKLDAKRPLKEHMLSWSTRPPCVRQLAPVDAKIGGEVELEPFAYVWANHNHTWGVFINQYQTL
ncbi:hypothetical protein NLJ89_g2314 [Agrocybe chaxingu]|uniref:Uncharacterized protein n=1 Tax=Agrocybe chaxingu TaxID=84603 RepID=A0A9W8MY62_9AGAR|nr:hypothetical protein NLJ89_g2314 [Agrocybe chaxingu]